MTPEQPLIWSAADKAAARAKAVEYACEATRWVVLASSDSSQEFAEDYEPAITAATDDACDLADVYAIAAFICWASTPHGAGGLP